MSAPDEQRVTVVDATGDEWVTLLEVGDVPLPGWEPEVAAFAAAHPELDAFLVGGQGPVVEEVRRAAVLRGSFPRVPLVVRRGVFDTIDAAIGPVDVDRTWATLIHLALAGNRIGHLAALLVTPRGARGAPSADLVIATLESVRTHPALLASEKEIIARGQEAHRRRRTRPTRRVAARPGAEAVASTPATDAALPLVSVVVPFFNETRFLDGAVETVRAQTLTDWELILVDDGSTDGSSSTAEHHARADPDRVAVATHPGAENRGLPASRNLGLARARGTFVAFLDADDRWEPDKLERQVDALTSAPDVTMTCGASWYRRLDGTSPPVRTPVTPHAPVTFGTGRFANALLRGSVNPPPPSDVLFRAAALRAAGGVPPGDNLYEDQRTFVAVNLQGPVHVTDETLSTYTLRDDSLYGSLSGDRALKRQQQRAFERWVVASGIRSGLPGLVLAGTVIGHRGKVAASGRLGDARRVGRRIRRRLRR